MNKTFFEEAREKALEEGEKRGRHASLRELLEARFGTLPESVEQRLQTMSLPEMKDLAKALLKAQSLADLGLDQ